MKKERVDVLAVEQSLFTSREQAKRAIMAGEVYNADNLRLDKPGEKIASDSQLHLKAGAHQQYVGRGAFKLAKALQVFRIDLKDRLCLDIGSSTGGFTDVALQNGARKVYALDVGYNQLAWKLREDPRVIVMERVNFRYSKPEDFTQGLPEFAMTDVSFISLKLILPPLQHILIPGQDAVCLIKPQFEAGPENVGKHGVVRDHHVHEKVLQDIINFSLEHNYDVLGLDFSPITGSEGNIEFLIHLRLSQQLGQQAAQVNITDVLTRAYEHLKQR
ncbi:TlyA family rRNA (cytidine-2'-O)-methyltransferase [Bombilactobacillus bombi]|uniref:TlyA family rRNA (Cytidine-2'-O)-methyltransferase n=1 Tax=Bombilactobacillus bombi TaxID=1303590 RepID=A0A3R6W8Y6_9LACO|nr:TlyA family RNA methyltransferase [Bombilactobacillus bombi]RHW49633.1 TlyA family rRNA (cytidine-2'-O)-methyltransferase [Bombilactobacillus bombi]